VVNSYELTAGMCATVPTVFDVTTSIDTVQGHSVLAHRLTGKKRIFRFEQNVSRESVALCSIDQRSVRFRTEHVYQTAQLVRVRIVKARSVSTRQKWVRIRIYPLHGQHLEWHPEIVKDQQRWLVHILDKKVDTTETRPRSDNVTMKGAYFLRCQQL